MVHCPFLNRECFREECAIYLDHECALLRMARGFDSMAVHLQGIEDGLSTKE